MRQPGDGAGFLLEAGLHVLGPADVRPEHLDREPAIELHVAALEHLAETAARDPVAQDVAGTERFGELLQQSGIHAVRHRLAGSRQAVDEGRAQGFFRRCGHRLAGCT